MEWNSTYNGTNYNVKGTKTKNYNLGSTPGDVKIDLQKNQYVFLENIPNYETL